MTFLKVVSIYWRTFVALGLPIALLPLPLLLYTKTASCAYAVIIMAVFWMTEVIPIPVTALLPCLFYPLFGILSPDAVTSEYLKESIMVFMGGLLVALAFEYCQLHKRIALRVILTTGTSLSMLMLGVMLTTAFLSMWMFNTATTAMMVPIITAVLDELHKSLKEVYASEGTLRNTVEMHKSEQHSLSAQERRSSTRMDVDTRDCQSSTLENDTGDTIVLKKVTRYTSIESEPVSECGSVLDESDECKDSNLNDTMKRLKTMFLLSTCYSSNIGGTGVITGSGTNLVALEFLGTLDPAHHGDYASLTFTTWTAFSLLPMILCIIIAWLYLQVVFVGVPDKFKFWKSESTPKSNLRNIFNPEIESKIKIMLESKYKELGSITCHEIGVLLCFLFAVLSWVTHDPKFLPGWSSWFPNKVGISTATLLVGVLFFVIPRNGEFYRCLLKGDFSKRIEPLIEWDFVQKRFPWGVIILLGGGYAMSKGAKAAGLSAWIGSSLTSLQGLPPWGILLTVMIIIAFLTEVASNTATASIVVPILLDLSQRLNIHPLYLTLPATVTCSFAFMLPVATPPNAIVYAAGDMKVSDMIRTGLFMNFACVIVLFITTNLYGNLIFHFSEYEYKP